MLTGEPWDEAVARVLFFARVNIAHGVPRVGAACIAEATLAVYVVQAVTGVMPSDDALVYAAHYAADAVRSRWGRPRGAA